MFYERMRNRGIASLRLDEIGRLAGTNLPHQNQNTVSPEEIVKNVQGMYREFYSWKSHVLSDWSPPFTQANIASWVVQLLNKRKMGASSRTRNNNNFRRILRVAFDAGYGMVLIGSIAIAEYRGRRLPPQFFHRGNARGNLPGLRWLVQEYCSCRRASANNQMEFSNEAFSRNFPPWCSNGKN